jgi:hypothetical protein
MIAAAAYRRLARGESDPADFPAEPTMKIENFPVEGYEYPKKARYKS